MARRATTLLLLFALLTGMGSGSAAPLLVCQMTGLPMPVAASPAAPESDDSSGAGVSCCHPKPVASAENHEAQSSLGRASCCDLKQAPDRDPQPAAFAATGALVALWMPAPPLPRPLTLTASAPRAPWASISVPRGPPLSDTPSRAPPAFS